MVGKGWGASRRLAMVEGDEFRPLVVEVEHGSPQLVVDESRLVEEGGSRRVGEGGSRRVGEGGSRRVGEGGSRRVGGDESPLVAGDEFPLVLVGEFRLVAGDEFPLVVVEFQPGVGDESQRLGVWFYRGSVRITGQKPTS